MNLRLQVFLIVVIVGFLAVLILLLQKGRLSLKYTLLWLFSDFVLLILALFPGIISWFARLFGIISPVNTVYVLEGIFVLNIMLSLTCIVSRQNNEIRSLIQENALLKERVSRLEEEKEGPQDCAQAGP